MAGAEQLFGVLAEYETSAELVKAAEAARGAGFTKMEAYTPHPVHGVEKAVGYKSRGRVQKIVLAGGIAGLLGGFGLAYWVHVIHYPFNVGGRPLATWVAFFPPAFELTILLAAFGAIFGMLALNGLPMYYHPVFNVPAFKRASEDRFFLSIESDDPEFDLARVREVLQGTAPVGVYDVEY